MTIRVGGNVVGRTMAFAFPPSFLADSRALGIARHPPKTIAKVKRLGSWEVPCEVPRARVSCRVPMYMGPGFAYMVARRMKKICDMNERVRLRELKKCWDRFRATGVITWPALYQDEWAEQISPPFVLCSKVIMEQYLNTYCPSTLPIDHTPEFEIPPPPCGADYALGCVWRRPFVPRSDEVRLAMVELGLPKDWGRGAFPSVQPAGGCWKVAPGYAHESIAATILQGTLEVMLLSSRWL